MFSFGFIPFSYSTAALSLALCASCLYWKIMSWASSEWERERRVIKFILDFIFISFYVFFSFPSYHIAFDATSAIQQYSGTNAEFTKADAVIFRSDIYNLTSGRKEFNFKRTLKYDSKWLDSKYFHHDETFEYCRACNERKSLRKLMLM